MSNEAREEAERQRRRERCGARWRHSPFSFAAVVLRLLSTHRRDPVFASLFFSPVGRVAVRVLGSRCVLRLSPFVRRSQGRRSDFWRQSARLHEERERILAFFFNIPATKQTSSEAVKQELDSPRPRPIPSLFSERKGYSLLSANDRKQVEKQRRIAFFSFFFLSQKKQKRLQPPLFPPPRTFEMAARRSLKKKGKKEEEAPPPPLPPQKSYVIVCFSFH